MGKQKRIRRRNNVVEEPSGEEKMEEGEKTEDAEMKDPTDLPSEDARTVHSVSKSYKSIKKSIGSTLSKVDKRNLKRSLFLQKIELNHELLKEAKKGKKSALPGTIDELNSLLPKGNMLHHTPATSKGPKVKQPKPVSTKIKGIKKTKQRQKEMELNLEAFKSVISDSQYKSSPLDVVTESIQNKVYNQIV